MIVNIAVEFVLFIFEKENVILPHPFSRSTASTFVQYIYIQQNTQFKKYL